MHSRATKPHPLLTRLMCVPPAFDRSPPPTRPASRTGTRTNTARPRSRLRARSGVPRASPPLFTPPSRASRPNPRARWTPGRAPSLPRVVSTAHLPSVPLPVVAGASVSRNTANTSSGSTLTRSAPRPATTSTTPTLNLSKTPTTNRSNRSNRSNRLLAFVRRVRRVEGGRRPNPRRQPPRASVSWTWFAPRRVATRPRRNDASTRSSAREDESRPFAPARITDRDATRTAAAVGGTAGFKSRRGWRRRRRNRRLEAVFSTSDRSGVAHTRIVRPR